MTSLTEKEDKVDSPMESPGRGDLAGGKLGCKGRREKESWSFQCMDYQTRIDIITCFILATSSIYHLLNLFPFKAKLVLVPNLFSPTQYLRTNRVL